MKPHLSAFLLVFGFAFAVRAQEVPDGELTAKIRETIKILAASGVTLTEADFDRAGKQDPPLSVSQAGPEFVEAWKAHRRAASVRGATTSTVLKPQVSVNAAGEEGLNRFEDLVNQLLKAPTPPTPEQIVLFTFSDFGDCGTPGLEFAVRKQEALLLAYLRNRRVAEALPIVMQPMENATIRRELLVATGFDSELVHAGGWLAGEYFVDEVVRDSSDKTARLLLKWAESHWNEEAKRYEATQNRVSLPETSKIKVPTTELLQLLRSDNEVTPGTKERVADLINRRGLEVAEARSWLFQLPPGAAQWLKPFAQAALTHLKNEVRLLAERTLREAGEVGAKAELQPPAKYRLYVNGELWRADYGLARENSLDLYVKYTQGVSHGVGTSPDTDEEGLTTVSQDLLLPSERVGAAEISSSPGGEPDQEAVWFKVALPIPADFKKITDLKVETVAVTIAPRFPRPLTEYKNEITKVEFGWADDDTRTYEMIGTEALVLSNVQPGAYWLRVRTKGAALSEFTKIEVKKGGTLFAPRLAVGSSVTVPLEWSDKMDLTAKPNLAMRLHGASWQGGGALFHCERDGEPISLGSEVLFPVEKSEEESEVPEKVVLSNLPVGRYRLRLLSSAEFLKEIPEDAQSPRMGWKSAQVDFEVTEKSPAVVRAPIMQIQSSQ